MDSLVSPTRPRPRRKRAWIIGLASFALVGAAVTGLLVTRGADGANPKGGKAGAKKGKHASADSVIAAPVEVSAVSRGDVSTFLESTTTLEPRNSATLVAKRQGQIVRLAAEEGATVAEGALLAQLDDTAARLAVERAQVTLDAAQKDLSRAKGMSAQGYMSTKEWDDLEAKVRVADVELKQAQHDLRETRIVAPFAGRVVARMVNRGETVTPGKECFTLVDFDPLLARVYFPEREARNVVVGQTAALTSETRPGETLRGRVWLVNPAVDKANGTFKVTLAVPNPGGALRPGSFARVRLTTGTRDNVLVMPRRGVVTEDGETFVFAARGDSVQRLPVKVGATEGETVQIVAGLTAGDRVVTVGQGGLKHGSKIRIVTF